jgi:CRP-like cAMP-binding protein
MRQNNVNDLDLKFPQNEHGDCLELTRMTVENLPPDGTLGRTLKVAREADIWRPGDRSDRLYFLKSGGVGIIAADREGRETTIGTVVVGEFFGELCFCGGATAHRRTTARTMRGSVVIETKIEDFILYMQRNAGVLQRCLFTFCIRLAHAERRVEILAMRGVEDRLGSALLHLAESSGVAVNAAERAKSAKLNVTHDELARLTALSRQRVTIMMNRFRELGLVRYDRNQPLIVHTTFLAAHLDGEKARR